MDNDTKQILTEQQLLSEVINHQGWSVVRKIFADKIMELQNIFNIDAKDPNQISVELQSRRHATQTLWDILREIEGSKEIVENNRPRHSFILNLEDEEKR